MYRIYTEKTVDDAVAKGLDELGVTEDDIKIEVIDSGSGGFLGFGRRDAEVKLTIINPELKTYGSIDAMLEQQSRKVQRQLEEAEEPANPEPAITEKMPERAEAPNQETPAAEFRPETEDSAEDEETLYESSVNSAADDTAAYISSVVREMNIQNDIEVSVKNTTVTIEFHAELAAKIIGKRGQTLNALQELAQNYFNTIYKSYGTVVLDVENYRAKRRETLESLAINMSKKAMRTGEPVKMEPMPSFERKIMHHVLSRVKHIDTYSEGREPNRYVVITKK